MIERLKITPRPDEPLMAATAPRTPKPNTYAGDPANIPVEMTQQRLWAVWHWMQEKDGRWSKPPFQSKAPKYRAGPRTPATWSAFDHACETVRTGHADGISFNLINSGIGAIDLDHCRNPLGQLDDWAMNIVDQAERFGAYIEITPSGTGLRVIGCTTGKELNRVFAVPGGATKAQIEIFRDTAKVITVTGARLPHLKARALPDIDKLLDDTVATYEAMPKPAPKAKGNGVARINGYRGDDYETFVREGEPEGANRSDTCHACVWHFAGMGLSLEEIVAEFEPYPNGVASRFIAQGRLAEEVERSYKSWQAKNLEPRASPRKDVRREEPPASPDDSLESVVASDVKMTALDWFWLNYFARGKIGVVGGLPDKGKGLITAYLMARASTGGLWPFEGGKAPLGNVILFTGEDTEDDVVVPRLAAAGADLSKIHIIRGVTSAKTKAKREFSLLLDLAALDKKIQEIGDVVLIIIDPMSAYFGIGKMDSYRTTDVRGVLKPLATLAAKHQCALIGVMHFNKKSGVNNAMLRLSDSLAFVAAPRHAYVVIDQPDTPGIRLFTRAKNNLTDNSKNQTLAYNVKTKSVGFDERLREEIFAPYVVWEGIVEISADQALADTDDRGDDGRRLARDEAKEFLEEFLKDGTPKPSEEIFNAAREAGHADRTIKRAASELPIRKAPSGNRCGKVWSLTRKEEKAK